MKNMKEINEEEVQKRIQNLDEEINRFNTSTIPKILKLLEDEEHGVVVSCYGLIAIVNALINEFGTEDLLNECIHYLENNMNNVEEIDN
jgi:hypothetical protein